MHLFAKMPFVKKTPLVRAASQWRQVKDAQARLAGSSTLGCAALPIEAAAGTDEVKAWAKEDAVIQEHTGELVEVQVQEKWRGPSTGASIPTRTEGLVPSDGVGEADEKVGDVLPLGDEHEHEHEHERADHRCKASGGRLHTAYGKLVED